MNNTANILHKKIPVQIVRMLIIVFVSFCNILSAADKNWNLILSVPRESQEDLAGFMDDSRSFVNMLQTTGLSQNVRIETTVSKNGLTLLSAYTRKSISSGQNLLLKIGDIASTQGKITQGKVLGERVFRTGALDEGIYLLTVKIVSLATSPARTVAEESVNFTIRHGRQLTLISPADEAICEENPQFVWAPVPDQFGNYRIQIVEVRPGQTPFSAFLYNQHLHFDESTENTTTLRYPANGVPFKEKTTYAWRVVMLLKIGTHDTLAKSEIRSFTFASKPEPDNRPTISFNLLSVAPVRANRWNQLTPPKIELLLKQTNQPVCKIPDLQLAGINGAEVTIKRSNASTAIYNGKWKKGSDSPLYLENDSTNCGVTITLPQECLDNLRSELTNNPDTQVVDVKGSDTTKSKKATQPDSSGTFIYTCKFVLDAKSIIKDTTICKVTGGTFGVTDSFTLSLKDIRNALKCHAPVVKDNEPDKKLTFKKGDTLKIGYYNLILGDDISNGSQGLSGIGIVKPFSGKLSLFKAVAIEVTFTNLKVNKSRQVYEGIVRAITQKGTSASQTESGNSDWGTKIATWGSGMLAKVVSSATSDKISGTTLPLAIDNNIGNVRVLLGIMDMEFTPNQATMDCAFAVDLSGVFTSMDNCAVSLGARGICFGPDGIGNGEITFYLPKDFGFTGSGDGGWGVVLHSQNVNGPNDKGTYVVWNTSEGVKEFNLSGHFALPRTAILPYDMEKMQPDSSGHVKISFQGLMDLKGGGGIFTGSMSPACIGDNFVLQVSDLSVDLSTSANPAGFEFPKGYTGVSDNTWKGVFLKQGVMSWQKGMMDSFFGQDSTTKQDEKPRAIAFNNFIISPSVWAGTVQGSNLNWTLGQWKDGRVSCDEISLGLQSPPFGVSLGVKGRAEFRTGDSTGTQDGKMILALDASYVHLGKADTSSKSVATNTWNIRFGLDKSWSIGKDPFKMSLDKTSQITLGNDNEAHAFETELVLNGSLSFLDSATIKIPDINFQNVGIRYNKKTGFRMVEKNLTGMFSFASPQKKLGGFPLSLSDVGVISKKENGKDQLGLQCKADVNLSGGTNAVGGGTMITIWLEIEDGNPIPRIKYKDVEIGGITINADLGAVTIDGRLEWYKNDSIYGNGFSGKVNGAFAKKILIPCEALFGTTMSGMQYWYLSAGVILPKGIPIASGAAIYGFNGAAWQNMRQVTASHDSGTGETEARFGLLPDPNTAFGLRAGITLGTLPSPVTFNADASFQAEFMRNGGISRIVIAGQGYMMSSMEDREKAPVKCDASLSYCIPDEALHGVFNMSVNRPPITGGGTMVLVADKKHWNIMAGEPEPRISLNVSSWMQAKAYFMAGQDLPLPPQPPAQVLAFTGPLQPARSDAVFKGVGIAFGGSASLSTGEVRFGCFYGHAYGMVGFDLSLLDYSTSFTCPEVQGTAGLNGWYGKGQFYAYMDVLVGMNVDLGFSYWYPCGWFKFCRGWVQLYKGDFTILNMTAAALLQGGGPNPMWLQGRLVGDYNILNGLVKGSCNFGLQFGNVCQPY